MTNKQPAKTAAERKRAQRQRVREAGRPDVPAFHAVLREHVLSLYQSRELSIEIPDLVLAVVTRLAGAATESGCRDTVRALLAKANRRPSAPCEAWA